MTEQPPSRSPTRAFPQTLLRQRTLVLVLALLVLLDLLILATLRAHYASAAAYGDTIYDAQVAREIARGNGYTSKIQLLYAVDEHFSNGTLADLWQSTHKFPLPALVRAALYPLFGDSDKLIHSYSILFHVLTVIAIALLGRAMANLTVGAVAALLYIGLNWFTAAAITGLNYPADHFLFTTSLLLLYLIHQRDSPALSLGLGLVLGLAFLNRYNDSIWLLPFGGYLAVQFFIPRFRLTPRLRRSTFAGFLLGAAIVILPWSVFQWIALGSPLVSTTGSMMLAHKTVLMPNDPWYLLGAEHFSLRDMILSHPGVLLEKWVVNLRSIVDQLIDIMQWPLLGALLFALIARRLDAPLKGTMLVAAGAFTLHLLGVGFLSHAGNYHTYILPFFVLLSAMAVYRVCELVTQDFRQQPTRNASELALTRVTAARFIAVSALLVFVTFFRGLVPLTVGSDLSFFSFPSKDAEQQSRERWDLDDQRYLRLIGERLSAESVVLSPAPWNTAWYADRRSMPIPPYPDQIYQLISWYGIDDIDAVYLVKLTGAGDGMMPTGWTGYRRMMEHNEPPAGFRVEELPADPGVGRVLLLRDPSVDFRQYLDSSVIDFGAQEGNSHLIYGWDANVFDLNPDGSRTTYNWTAAGDAAQVTFLSTDSRPRQMTLVIAAQATGIRVRVVLNERLFDREDLDGVSIGEFSTREQSTWQEYTLTLPSSIRSGVNTLTFHFERPPGAAGTHLAFDRVEFTN